MAGPSMKHSWSPTSSFTRPKVGQDASPPTPGLPWPLPQGPMFHLSSSGGSSFLSDRPQVGWVAYHWIPYHQHQHWSPQGCVSHPPLQTYLKHSDNTAILTLLTDSHKLPLIQCPLHPVVKKHSPPPQRDQDEGAHLWHLRKLMTLHWPHFHQHTAGMVESFKYLGIIWDKLSFDHHIKHP